MSLCRSRNVESPARQSGRSGVGKPASKAWWLQAKKPATARVRATPIKVAIVRLYTSAGSAESRFSETLRLFLQIRGWRRHAWFPHVCGPPKGRLCQSTLVAELETKQLDSPFGSPIADIRNQMCAPPAKCWPLWYNPIDYEFDWHASHRCRVLKVPRGEGCGSTGFWAVPMSCCLFCWRFCSSWQEAHLS